MNVDIICHAHETETGRYYCIAGDFNQGWIFATFTTWPKYTHWKVHSAELFHNGIYCWTTHAKS